MGAGELAVDLVEENIDGLCTGAMEGPRVIEPDVSVKGRCCKYDIAPRTGDEGESGEKSWRKVYS
jgi:hypothetical protein